MEELEYNLLYRWFVGLGMTDPEARLMRRKGKESKLSYQGHVLMENRHGLAVAA